MGRASQRMRWHRPVAAVSFWAGLVAFLASVALLLASQVAPARMGWEDLARIAGAMLSGAVAGLLLGTFLLVNWLGRARPAAWRLVAADAGAIWGAILAGALVAAMAPALPAASIAPIALAALALAVAIAGLGASVPLWKVRRAR